MADRGVGFGHRPNENPGVDDLVRTDRFIDALAAQTPVDCGDDGDRALADLLSGWRDELRSPPANAGVKAVPAARRRGRPGLIVVGSAAATLLALGGFAAVVGSAQSGDSLYGLRSVLFGAPKSTDDQVMISAKSELDKVAQMVAAAQWDQAQQRLASLGDTVQMVGDAERRDALVAQWNRLLLQVQQRNPNAVPATNGTTVSVIMPVPTRAGQPPG